MCPGPAIASIHSITSMICGQARSNLRVRAAAKTKLVVISLEWRFNTDEILKSYVMKEIGLPEIS